MAREIAYNNFQISLVGFMSNITTNHAITYTNKDVFLVTGVFFAWACAPRPDKEHTSVTATVVHSHRNQILHFESLVEIQMVAGT